MQRPERVVFLSAPQGFFGLALNGWVLIGVVCILAVSAWTTAIHRVAYVRRATKTTGSAGTIRVINEKKKFPRASPHGEPAPRCRLLKRPPPAQRPLPHQPPVNLVS